MLTIPIRVLLDAVGHNVTIEMKTKEIYRGRLIDSETNMNLLLNNVTFIGKDGRISKLEDVYIRGSHIRFIVLPDIIKNSPIFNTVLNDKVVFESKKKQVKKNYQEMLQRKKGKDGSLPPSELGGSSSKRATGGNEYYEESAPDSKRMKTR